jgi:hypothetical protein
LAGDEIQNLLRSGIQAARSGNKAQAKEIFERVLRVDSQNELAWLWMASVLESQSDRRRALERVLSINPSNERAQQALAKLRGEAPAAPPPPPPVPQAPSTPTTRAEIPAWARKAEPRRSGLSTPVFIGALILAVVFIGLALALFLLDSGENDPETQVVSTSPTVVATNRPVSATPEPRLTIVSVGEFNMDVLPPTWTPLPTNTPTATVTVTPPSTSLTEFELIFSGADDPAALSGLFSIRADGNGLEAIEVDLPGDALEVIPSPTATATPQELSPDEIATSEAAESTSEAPEEEENAPAEESEPANAPETQIFDRVEFIDPVYSPDASSIVFTAQVAPDSQELFLLTLADGNTRQITNLQARNVDGAAWSPDGTQIAFAANRAPSVETTAYDIYIYDLETSEITSASGEIGQNRDPNWSPDGTQLVFSSDRTTPGELEIWALTIGRETEAVQLTNAGNSSFSPAFSHDGTLIAFISNREGDNDLYLMNADGSDEHVITVGDEDAEDRDPAWSPDDVWIALSSNRGDSRAFQLWALNLLDNQWRAITITQGIDRYPDWRPVETLTPEPTPEPQIQTEEAPEIIQTPEVEETEETE